VAITRRLFFRWATGISSLLSTALVGLPSLRAFLAPLTRKEKRTNWIKLGEVDQIEAGTPTRFDFAESVNDAWVETRALRGVWIYTDDNEAFTVYNAHCPHLACSYAFEKEKGIFHCPCHHGLFELKTGKVLDGPPPRALDTLETKVEDGVLYAAYQDFRAGIPEKVAVS
jgi:menaquinol-cytochrome c reductase iron-sulfur subunit